MRKHSKDLFFKKKKRRKDGKEGKRNAFPSWAGSPASPCLAPVRMQDAPFGMDFPITSTAGEQLVPQGTLLALWDFSRDSLRAQLCSCVVSPDAQRGWEAAQE